GRRRLDRSGEDPVRGGGAPGAGQRRGPGPGRLRGGATSAVARVVPGPPLVAPPVVPGDPGHEQLVVTGPGTRQEVGGPPPAQRRRDPPVVVDDDVVAHPAVREPFGRSAHGRHPGRGGAPGASGFPALAHRARERATRPTVDGWRPTTAPAGPAATARTGSRTGTPGRGR